MRSPAPFLAAACLLIAAGAACATATAPGSPGAPGALPIPADLVDLVRASEAVGAQLYVLDRASAIGTDVLEEKVPDWRGRKLAGWITLRECTSDGRPLDAHAVMFFTAEDPPRQAYTIHVPFKGPPTLETFLPPRRVTDALLSMYRARQAAKAAVPRHRRPFNPVILPGSLVGRPRSHLVYLLAAEHVPGEIVFGIHYRVLVSAATSAVEEVQPLSTTALERPPPAQPLPPGARFEEEVVSQLMTDWPTEAHVFVSLLHGRVPIAVVTRRGLWRVVGNHISYVAEQPALPSDAR